MPVVVLGVLQRLQDIQHTRTARHAEHSVPTIALHLGGSLAQPQLPSRDLCHWGGLWMRRMRRRSVQSGQLACGDRIVLYVKSHTKLIRHLHDRLRYLGDLVTAQIHNCEHGALFKPSRPFHQTAMA
ncbi:hypothetical protein D3C81_1825590 [compost metagenome]